MKTDNYLTLCLEQAAKSPLHYRHGSIIVRGGKVVGQGYNDYRPGFNGGVLKNGRIANSAMDGPAMADLKEKLKKQKQKPRPKEQQRQDQQDDTTICTPFGGMSGRHQPNVPLSMHSEMMAIHSALAAASTLSSTAFSCEKPCVKLSSGDKRKARLRADALKRYVDAVCDATSTSSARSGVGKLRIAHHQNYNKHSSNGNGNENDEEALEKPDRLAQRGPRGCQRAFPAPPSGGKHHHHQKRKEKQEDGEKKGIRYRESYDQYGQQKQADGRQPSAFEYREGEALRDYESMVHEAITITSQEASPPASQGKHQRVGKRSKKSTPLLLDETLQPELMLLPLGQSAPSTSDRKKHPRLMGADMYVARLGWSRDAAVGSGSESDDPPKSFVPSPAPLDAPNLDGICNIQTPVTSSHSCLFSNTHSFDGSLHGELLVREASPPRRPSAAATISPHLIRASRPCYRCISYMHSVGIKRVFWTTDEGGWEGGKVRDLVEALDRPMESMVKGDGDGGATGGPTNNGVFVTKHEVLRMKRIMGEA